MSIDYDRINKSFYFFNSVISPENLIRRYSSKQISPRPGYITNAFGVVVDPKFFPMMSTNDVGKVDPLPIPSNWHADMAEFGAALRSVDLAKDTFTMVELGCGWGCWMNITGVVAKRKGLAVHVIGVEGDTGHVDFAKSALAENGFTEKEYTLYHGIAASSSGTALFPKQQHAGASWGLEPLFGLTESQAKKKLKTGEFDALKQFALKDICRDYSKIDFLHVDIQGGEAKLIPDALPFLNEKVAYLFIGTHSRQIEALLLDSLLSSGWILEIERPAILAVGASPSLVVDGVQGWRNPRLLPQVDMAEPQGRLTLIDRVPLVGTNETFELMVEITNTSDTDWEDVGHTPVLASYQWSAGNDVNNIAIPEPIRTRLSDTIVRAGTTVAQKVTVVAPSTAGNYRLRIALVQEGVRWFDAPEFQSETFEVQVIAGIKSKDIDL